MNILLPIETINREIDFKIVLASILSGQGHKIYIGQHDFLMSLLPSLHGGLYIGKNLFTKRSDLETGEKYNILKERGFDIIYLHEEGAVFGGRENDWIDVLKRQYSLDFFDENDRICVWGEFQAQVDYSRSEGLNIATTGHPRFDLYKKKWNSYFDEETNQIKSRYSSYILINGNYGLANHGLGISHVFSENGNYIAKDVEKRLKRIGFYAYSSKQLVSIINLTHHLAVKYPDRYFIYRPHPSENHDYYKTLFSGVENIIVNHDGSVGPWILGADAIIHDGCTTAIEATLAGKPVINFKPFHDEQFDIWLPNQLGIRATSNEDVFNILDNLKSFNHSRLDSASFEKLTNLFYNFKGDSFESILKIIDSKIEDKHKYKSISPSLNFIRAKFIKMRLKQEFAKKFNSVLFKNSKYHGLKFYGFEHSFIKNKFLSVQNLMVKQVYFKIHNSFLIEVQ
ncbi:surface carbohydrate biosynthesis protein [Pontibacter roseus]|uniref:surface carbohydrate biosynthesis protein n=1 Tax=Pontibacter roseus TaxID=336989 RepID=UPI00037E2651|nr:surface carbohydrate biosynthesis protein [Pontibacter roseus]